MTPEEHDHVQALEGKVKRYRSRIALLKESLLKARIQLDTMGAWPQTLRDQINAALARNVGTDADTKEMAE